VPYRFPLEKFLRVLLRGTGNARKSDQERHGKVRIQTATGKIKGDLGKIAGSKSGINDLLTT
jgi:hypothetical protein